MSDCAVLLTVGPAVLQYLVHNTANYSHAVATLRAFEALRRSSTVLFYVPAASSEGEKAMKERPTVAGLQSISESLMIELRQPLPFEANWECPSVRRVLQLL